MGKVRPKVRDLLRLCLEMKAVAAASYISESILCRAFRLEFIGAHF